MTDPAAAGKNREYLKVGMVGCGSVLLLFLVMATVVGSLVSRHPEQYRAVLLKAFDALEDGLTDSFAADVSPADRAAFAGARERFRREWIAGRIPASAADRLRRRLIADSRKGRLGPEDVRSLTRFLDGLASPAARAA